MKNEFPKQGQIIPLKLRNVSDSLKNEPHFGLEKLSDQGFQRLYYIAKGSIFEEIECIFSFPARSQYIFVLEDTEVMRSNGLLDMQLLMYLSNREFRVYF